MARDGSSGGCIRMCVITKDKVERHFIPGNELPRFWEGLEIVGEKKSAAPFAVAA
jgi:20S proteasome subunit beta 1